MSGSKRRYIFKVTACRFISIWRKNVTENLRKGLPLLATAATRFSKFTALTCGTSKTLSKTTSIVQQKNHIFLCSTVSSQIQNHQLSSESLKRVESISSVFFLGVFCQNKLTGKLKISSDLLFVRLVYDKKFTFENVIIHNVKFVGEKSKAIQVKKHSSLKFVYRQTLNHQWKHKNSQNSEVWLCIGWFSSNWWNCAFFNFFYRRQS